MSRFIPRNCGTLRSWTALAAAGFVAFAACGSDDGPQGKGGTAGSSGAAAGAGDGGTAGSSGASGGAAGAAGTAGASGATTGGSAGATGGTAGASGSGGMSYDDRRIQPFAGNPWYWQYEGEPVLLVGATDEDNVFQLDQLEQHLDEMALAGGNYVRNTMSSRDDGNLFPFADAGNGKYDLSQWNDAYWERFEKLLEWTHARDIIVQVEVWDRFDHSRDPWLTDPYNPANNVNYDYAESGFDPTYPNHPSQNQQPFFHTVPALDDNTVVRTFQEAFVDKMLSHSLVYDHVLYAMDNETDDDPAWGAYWAEYIRSAAQAAGVRVETTEMWDDRNILTSDQHKNTWDHREIYTFTDISQNNHMDGDTHWNQIQYVRDYLAADPMPINGVKIYGADTGTYGTSVDAVQRFWRSLVGGMASSRFHRPTAGLGLSEVTEAQLRAVRMLESKTLLFGLQPAQHLLSERSSNEAFACADPGVAYVVYFPLAGAVKLDLSGQSGSFRMDWLNLEDATWGSTDSVDAGAVSLQAPWGHGSLAVLVPE